jgi:hypothetical protein
VKVENFEFNLIRDMTADDFRHLLANHFDLKYFRVRSQTIAIMVV